MTKARAALLLAVIALAAAHLIRSARPAWSEIQSDFPNLYVAGRLLQAGGNPFDLYDLVRFQGWVRRSGIENRLVVFEHYAPLSAWSWWPLAVIAEPLTAQRLWLIANLLFGVLAACCLARLARRPWLEGALLLLISGLALGNNLRLGQVYLLVMLLIAASYLALRADRDLTAALLWGAAVALKPYPLLLILYPLWRRRWRALALSVAVLAALVAISVALLGWELHAYYVHEILPDSLRGLVVDPFSAYNPTPTTLAHRLFLTEPQLNPAPLADWPRAASLGPPCLGALLLAWVLSRTPARGRREGPVARRGFALLALLPLLLAPVVSTYTLILLLPSAALAWGDASRRRSIVGRASILLAVGLLGLDWVRFGLDLEPRFGSSARFLRLGVLLLFAALLWSWSQPQRRGAGRWWKIGALSGAYLLPALLASDPFPATADAARPYPVTAPPLAQLQPTDLDGQLVFLASSPAGLYWRRAADPSPISLALPPPPGVVAGEPAPSAPAAEPAVSPDGRRIAFSAWRQGNWDIFVLIPATGRTIRLTCDPARDRDPLWIDDRTLVFSSDRRRGIGFAALYALDLAPQLAGSEREARTCLTPRETALYKRP